MRPSRYLFTLATIFIVLYAVVLGFGSGSIANRLKPKLGLDLIGGTTLTLVAQTLDGKPPSAESLQQARQIIENRVNASGVSEAEVVTEGNDQIVISAPGQNNDSIRQLGATALLRFRKVLATTTDLPANATPSASPSASASGSASASPSASAKPSPTPTPTPTPAATATPSGTAKPSASPSGTVDVQKIQNDIRAKLGDTAIAAASQIQDPTQIDEATHKVLEPFRKLTPQEVQYLPPQIQFNVPEITCETLNNRPAGSIEDMTKQAVACEQGGNQKYMLDVAKVEGRDIESATANISSGTGSQWQVDLVFNGDGTKKWTTLTREAFNNDGGNCKVTQPRESGSGAEVCMVAVVLDNEVVSAPSIQGVLTSKSQITGSFNKTSASLLANQLKFGALPVSFTQQDLLSISATLGTDYLRAGLLAMGIGMLLVIIYAFFYYRLLGSVITLSLILSAMLTFGMLVLLGRQMGFTLTLAGIAGFIVSLGVAADSFVIYFERLKDEIREGRSPRSAVPRAWHRARRTIITANAVTILAAVVLYLLGSGQVKGFAFALGLATMLDLVIVFLFRHPMMTMLANTPAFLSPRVSGLGRVLETPGSSSKDAPSSGTARPKEA
jgi:preprotein translocase subunit SecD